jgi:hypothetical protein
MGVLNCVVQQRSNKNIFIANPPYPGQMLRNLDRVIDVWRSVFVLTTLLLVLFSSKSRGVEYTVHGGAIFWESNFFKRCIDELSRISFGLSRETLFSRENIQREFQLHVVTRSVTCNRTLFTFPIALTKRVIGVGMMAFAIGGG